MHRRSVWAVALTATLIGGSGPALSTPAAGASAASGAAPATGGSVTATCEPTLPGDHSVARLWDEQILAAIRRDVPAPTVHARNLFHLSAAMWDAWAAYDEAAVGVFVDERLVAADAAAARDEAISYAAYRLLSARYAGSVGAEESLEAFDDAMQGLCYATEVTTTVGAMPAALGNRIAATILEAGLSDGSNEAAGYQAPDYQPVNEPLIVKLPDIEMVDPNRWQPLALEFQETQNDIPLPDKVQTFIGAHWGHVKAFALPGSEAGLPLDPGAQPRLGDPLTDATFKAEALEVLRLSSWIDPSDGVVMDISPAAMGDNILGTNDGNGHSVNPRTGLPYVPNPVLRADYIRSIAEFWADGPASETPPGHWNTIANAVTDTPGFARRIGGTGPEVDPLEWDVKLYLALNGALHDAAVAAWGIKGHYDGPRPISMIRYMAAKGQSSNPELPSFDPAGLPLEPGLVELVTRRSSQPGRRHAAFADHIGEVVVKAWGGNPQDPETQTSGTSWVLGRSWLPYQKATFVTPAFAGYVSGHSTFSRAAAEVMTAITGDAFFPGGLFEWTIPAGELKFEAGPTTDVTFGWATYFDAADQVGDSRLYMGIHVRADDLHGRRTGSMCGKEAWLLAQRHYSGASGV